MKELSKRTESKLRKTKAFLILLLCINCSNGTIAQESIQINAAADSNFIQNYTGFLHGQTQLRTNPSAIEFMMELKPRFWRNANWNSTQILADSLNLTTSLVMSDFYSDHMGGYSNAKPWLDWSGYETFVDTVADLFIAAGLAPAYWDIWNEPDLSQFWSGTLEQLIECYVRAATTLRAVDPSIGLVGPSISSYQPYGIEYFLDSLASHGIQLDAVSWHEFGLPDSLALHTADFRNRSAMNPQWGNPDIHINEYSPPQSTQIPAFRLAWLYFLEQENVQWATTACWDDHSDGSQTWSGCSYGLDGLLSYDEQSPLPVYWLQRAYADVVGWKRLFCTRSDNKTLALSARNDSLQEMRILTGRYYSDIDGNYLPTDLGKDSANVALQISNYPYVQNGLVPLLIQRILRGDAEFLNSPLAAPETIFEGNAIVSNGNITISLPNFHDGDVYISYLNPSAWLGESKPLSAIDLVVFPNPAGDEITIQTGHFSEEISMKISTVTGIILFEDQVSEEKQTFDISKLPSGVYILQLNDASSKLLKL